MPGHSVAGAFEHHGIIAQPPKNQLLGRLDEMADFEGPSQPPVLATVLRHTTNKLSGADQLARYEHWLGHCYGGKVIFSGQHAAFWPLICRQKTQRPQPLSPNQPRTLAVPWSVLPELVIKMHSQHPTVRQQKAEAVVVTVRPRNS